MESILNKIVSQDSANIRALEQLQYDLNSTNSDSDIGNDDEDSRDAALAIEENILKYEDCNSEKVGTLLSDNGTNSETKMDIDTDIILPEASQNITTHREKKKEKTKKELEEEEREKMQLVTLRNIQNAYINGINIL